MHLENYIWALRRAFVISRQQGEPATAKQHEDRDYVHYLIRPDNALASVSPYRAFSES